MEALTRASTTTRRRVAWLLAALLVVTMAVGGGWWALERTSGDPSVPKGYDAVPDQDLLAAIRALPQVSSASLEYHESWVNGDYYDGEVHLEPGLTQNERYAVRDHTMLILRHGRWAPDENYGTVYLLVPQGPTLVPGRESLFATIDPDRIYGPQTGRKDWPAALADLAARAVSGPPAFCRELPYPYLANECRDVAFDSSRYDAPGPADTGVEPPIS